MPLFSYPDLQRKADVIRGNEYGLFRKTASQVLTEAAISFSEKQAYDVFLSHSSRDAYFILALRTELLGMGYNVYIDWIEDPHLDRTQVTKNTADLLRRRMKVSKSLFIVSTENARESKWVPWELGYFDGFKEKVAILPIANSEFPDESYYGQEYLGLYPYVTRAMNQVNRKETLWIHESVNRWVHFDEWLRGQKPMNHEKIG